LRLLLNRNFRRPDRHRNAAIGTPNTAKQNAARSHAVIFFSPPLRRILTFSTAISMVLPSLPAGAQEAAPPARVGQIAAIDGGVSFNGAGSGGWAAASLNYPVSGGDSLYTQDGGQAAIALDASRITLAADTELQITQLDQNDFAATQTQGEVFFSVNDLQPGQNFTVTTPRGSVAITQNGEYDLAAGDTSAPTVVTVFQGAATITAPGATLNVPAGQAGVLSGSDQTVAQLGQAEPDAFDNALLAQAAPPPPPYVPPVAEQMTGASELGTYGSWDQSPQYGAIWYPRVNAGWAPYREGHWAFVPPWGWTWVENEPWGFAPFHYGRWVDEDNRWGWAPCPAYQQGGDYGPDYRPVYAPAVVSFFGLAVVAGITAAALSSGSVGWVPLGPNEAYYPPYRTSPDYVRRINYVNVRDINNVHVTNNYYDDTGPGNFANRRAATFIPAADMSRGAPVARYGRPVPPADFANARPINPGAARPAAEGPDFRLPSAAAPLAHEHPGVAPRPTEFATRRSLPPAVISREPATHFAGPAAATFRPPGLPETRIPAGAAAPESRPAFGANPAYRAPPVPATHLGALPETHVPAAMRPPEPAARPLAPPVFQPQAASPQAASPQAASRPALPQVHYGQEQPARPPAPPVFHPQAVAPPVFHPQAEAPVYRPQPAPPVFHPQAVAPPVFHPEAEAPRPAPPAFHPAEAPRPEPPAPRPSPEKHNP
jgi:hypothetical protein